VARQAYVPGPLASLWVPVASAVLALCTCLTPYRLPRRQHKSGILLRGVVGIVDYHFAGHFGQRTVTAEATTLLSHTSLSFTVVSAMRFLKERLRLPGRARTRLRQDSSDDVR
jgi:drug/metabolite transporter (DMT)-like permease